jgi:mono/diheme cytochrome c family protein
LEPPPADLVVHVPLHPDAALFNFIENGIPGTAMAPLGSQLTDEEIWHVINYIRSFEEPTK